MKYYQRLYVDLTMSCKLRGLDKSRLDFYTENHHICMECLGGGNEDSNRVLLTAREHVIAHWLLTKFLTGSDYYKAQHALASFMMAKGGRKLTVRQVAIARAAHSAYMRGPSNPSKSQKNRDASSKRLIERSLAGYNPGKSQKSRDSASKRQAVVWSGPGNPMLKQKNKDAKSKQFTEMNLINNPSKTPESRLAQSQLMAKTMSKPENKAIARATQKAERICPWCNKHGKGNAMLQHHFDNCLEHPENKGLTRKQIKERRKRA